MSATVALWRCSSTLCGEESERGASRRQVELWSEAGSLVVQSDVQHGEKVRRATTRPCQSQSHTQQAPPKFSACRLNAAGTNSTSPRSHLSLFLESLNNRWLTRERIGPVTLSKAGLARLQHKTEAQHQHQRSHT